MFHRVLDWLAVDFSNLGLLASFRDAYGMETEKKKEKNYRRKL